MIRYDAGAQSLNADLHYEPLQMDSDDTLREVGSRWIERLQRTGIDAATD